MHVSTASASAPSVARSVGRLIVDVTTQQMLSTGIITAEGRLTVSNPVDAGRNRVAAFPLHSPQNTIIE